MEITFKIIKHFGTISTNANGWNKEVNLVSWNNGSAKIDIREWSPDHKIMSKGITLTEDEMSALVDLMKEAL